MTLNLYSEERLEAIVWRWGRMYPDPSRFSEVDLESQVDYRRQQVAASHRQGVPRIYLVLLLPFVLIARGFLWGLRRNRPPQR